MTVETAGHINPDGTHTWVDLSGSDVAGPNFQLPFTGVYAVRFGARMQPAQSGQQVQCGVSIANNIPNDNQVAGNGNPNNASVSRSLQVSANAGNWLRLWYRDFGSSGTDQIDNRFIEIVPIRCI